MHNDERTHAKSVPATSGRGWSRRSAGIQRSCDVAESQYAVALQLGGWAGGPQHLTVKINNLRNITHSLGLGGRFFETTFLWLRVQTSGGLT